MPNVFIKTLGCKVNSFDGHAIENQLVSKGYKLVSDSKQADVSIINSCSVTSTAEKDARYLLRRFKKENPEGKRIITGCYAQIDSATLSELDSVDIVIPNEAKGNIGDLIADYVEKGSGFENKLPVGLKSVSKNKQGHFKSSLALFDKANSNQTRAFIKIQDGCNGFCAYCQIPYARGQSASINGDLVVSEVKRLAKLGTKEIVLAGIHIGDYGDDFDIKTNNDPEIVSLLDRLVQIDGLARIRISSLEPAEFSLPLAKFMENHKEKFCAHFHLPLQAGCDTVLKRMRRQYDTARYKGSIEQARELFDDCFIGTDIIPGFPQETDEEFEQGYSFIESLDLTALHVFPYSKRPNTAAIKMPGHVEEPVKKARAAKLRELSRTQTSKFYKQSVGKLGTVLWEKTKDSEGRLIGKTSNYLNVVASEKLMSTGITPNTMSEVKLVGLVGDQKLLGI